MKKKKRKKNRTRIRAYCSVQSYYIYFQLFSVLFFLMLYVLGIGSAVALVGAINTIICDQFPTWKQWHVVIGTAAFGFFAGILYCTPVSVSRCISGLSIDLVSRNLRDYFAQSCRSVVRTCKSCTTFKKLFAYQSNSDDK